MVDWPQILARHDRWLRTAVLARLRDPDGVDEVMQRVAVAAIEQRAPLLDQHKAAPWLFRLAIWQTLLYRRRAGSNRKLAVNYTREIAATGGHSRPDPLAWLLSKEQRQLVAAALERLSRRDVEILLLKYTEDWSYRELAMHLGISEAAVEARLHRARGRLRSELARANVNGD
jgi:RNA polymerase sigma factor (sigma-70 family)